MVRPNKWDREPTDAELKAEEAELERLISEQLATMPDAKSGKVGSYGQRAPGIKTIKHKMRRSKGPRGA